MRHLLICGMLQLVALAQPVMAPSLSSCEEHFPELEVKFAHDFNPYIERYHKLTISVSPSAKQLEDGERVFREFMALYRCGCF